MADLISLPEMTQLSRDLLAQGIGDFKVAPFYSELGDFLSVYFSPDESYEERIDSVLTVYRSMDSGDIVGCKIKGVSVLARKMVNFIDVIEDNVKLSLILMNAAAQQVEHEQHYYDLGSQTKTIAIPAPIFRKMANHSKAA